MAEHLFPIMGSYRYREEAEKIRAAGCCFSVVGLPWAMIAPHEKQALENHSQSLRRLAERGGLSPDEALAVLDDRPWAPVQNAHGKLADRIWRWSGKDTAHG